MTTEEVGAEYEIVLTEDGEYKAVDRTKVLIATVAGGPPNWPFVDSVFGLKAPGEKMFRHIAGKQGVDEGHNKMIEWFLSQTDYDWMLHLDTDAVVHTDTLLRLLSWNEPFVSALAFRRWPCFEPVVFKDTINDKDHFSTCRIKMTAEWIRNHPQLMVQGLPMVLDPRPIDALYEVDSGGAHCLLTHRRVLGAVGHPWFTRSGTSATDGRGSDFDFYRKAKAAGFKTYLDRSVMAGHLVQDYCAGAVDFVIWNRKGAWLPHEPEALDE